MSCIEGAFSVDLLCLGNSDGSASVYEYDSTGQNVVAATSFIVLVDGYPLMLVGCGPGVVRAYRSYFGPLALLPKHIYLSSSASHDASDLSILLMAERGRHLRMYAGDAAAQRDSLINVIAEEEICNELVDHRLHEASKMGRRKAGDDCALHGTLCHFIPLKPVSSGEREELTSGAAEHLVSNGYISPVMFTVDDEAGIAHTLFVSCAAIPDSPHGSHGVTLWYQQSPMEEVGPLQVRRPVLTISPGGSQSSFDISESQVIVSSADVGNLVTTKGRLYTVCSSGLKCTPDVSSAIQRLAVGQLVPILDRRLSRLHQQGSPSLEQPSLSPIPLVTAPITDISVPTTAVLISTTSPAVSGSPTPLKSVTFYSNEDRMHPGLTLRLAATAFTTDENATLLHELKRRLSTLLFAGDGFVDQLMSITTSRDGSVTTLRSTLVAVYDQLPANGGIIVTKAGGTPFMMGRLPFELKPPAEPEYQHALADTDVTISPLRVPDTGKATILSDHSTVAVPKPHTVRFDTQSREEEGKESSPADGVESQMTRFSLALLPPFHQWRRQVDTKVDELLSSGVL